MGSAAKTKKRLKRKLHIKDDYDGDLDARSVTVHVGATLHGDVGAERVVVLGAVRGVIKANTISIGPLGRIEGELQYGRLSVDPGARIEARCIPA